MLIAIKDGKILTNEKETFYKRVDIMLADLVAKKDAPVPGFDIQDTKHRDTLFEIRDIYRIEWAVYVISKLSENSE